MEGNQERDQKGDAHAVRHRRLREGLRVRRAPEDLEPADEHDRHAARRRQSRSLALQLHFAQSQLKLLIRFYQNNQTNNEVTDTTYLVEFPL